MYNVFNRCIYTCTMYMCECEEVGMWVGIYMYMYILVQEAAEFQETS